MARRDVIVLHHLHLALLYHFKCLGDFPRHRNKDDVDDQIECFRGNEEPCFTQVFILLVVDFPNLVGNGSAKRNDYANCEDAHELDYRFRLVKQTNCSFNKVVADH